MRSMILYAGALLAATSTNALAATVVVNHYDPANILPGNVTGELLAAPITLGAGDTLDMTFTFAGGATVFANGEDGLWSLVLTSSGPSATLQTSGTLEFLGASANIVSGPIALSDENGFIHLGNYYSSNLYRLDANQISFTGLRQVITIDSDDIGQAREYQSIALTYFSGQVGAEVVPEPATWAMMIGGFGLIGAAARRRPIRTQFA